MDDQELVLSGELHDLLEEPLRCDRARRVVRIVEEHEARFRERHRIDRIEVGHEAKRRVERQDDRLGAGEDRAARVDGIAGIRCERDVAGVEEREAEVVDALLGADRRDDLGLGVDLDAEAALVEAGERLAELGAPAVRRVLVGPGVGDGRLHRLDDVRIGGRVRIADAQRDHVDPGRLL